MEINLIKQFSTAEFADAMDGENVMDCGIKPIGRNMKIAGQAFTIRLPFGSGRSTLDLIDRASKGDVVVITTDNTSQKAALGDLKALIAKKRDIAGIIVDGAIRDLSGIMNLGIPVFFRHVTPAPISDEFTGEINVQVKCGNVLVNPGDIVVGDDDGVVVIPSADIEKVLKKAAIKHEFDIRRRENSLKI